MAILWSDSIKVHLSDSKFKSEIGMYLISEWSITKMYSKGGIMKVRHVIVLPPTRFRMLPKLGTLSAIKSRKAMLIVLKRHLFQLNSERLRKKNNETTYRIFLF